MKKNKTRSYSSTPQPLADLADAAALARHITTLEWLENDGRGRGQGPEPEPEPKIKKKKVSTRKKYKTDVEQPGTTPELKPRPRRDYTEVVDKLLELCNGAVSRESLHSYAHRYGLRSVYDKLHVIPCTAVTIGKPAAHHSDIWNSWMLAFRVREMFGATILDSGLAVSAVFEEMDENVDAVLEIVQWIGKRFKKPVSGAAAVSVTVLSLEQFHRRLSGETPGHWRDMLHVAVAVWLCELDWKWQDVIDEGDGRTRLDFLSVRFAGILDFGIFKSRISTHTGLECGEKFNVSRACAIARSIYLVKQEAEEWRCQFTNMHLVMRAAESYYSGCMSSLRTTADSSKARVPAGDVLTGFVSRSSIDFTDASFAEPRLLIEEYSNDFSWLFVAAYVIATIDSDPPLNEGDTIDAISRAVADAEAWGSVMVMVVPVPSPRPIIVAPAVALLPAEMRRLSVLRRCTGNTDPLRHLQAMLGTRGLGFSFTSETIPDVGFWFEFADYAFEESQFTRGSRARNLKGIFRVLQQKIREKSTLEVFCIASLLMHREINSMFYVDECEAKTALIAVLKRETVAFPRAKCFSPSMDFMAHASTMLWAWMFEHLGKRVNIGDTCAKNMRHTMALACEASVCFPELEQVALWAAFVRLIGLPTHTTASGMKIPSTSVAAATAASASHGIAGLPGKFAGIGSAGQPIFEPFADIEEVEEKTKAGQDMETHAQTQVEVASRAFHAKAESDLRLLEVVDEFRLKTEPCARAAACLSSSQKQRLVEFMGYDEVVRAHAIVERILFRGDWIVSMDCANVLKDTLFQNKDMPIPIVSEDGDGDGEEELEFVSPHIDSGDSELSPLTAALKAVVDTTRGLDAVHTNAVLHFLHPVKMVETVIQRAALCVQWECRPLPVKGGK